MVPAAPNRARVRVPLPAGRADLLHDIRPGAVTQYVEKALVPPPFGQEDSRVQRSAQLKAVAFEPGSRCISLGSNCGHDSF